jgi:hypothetical protein
MKSNTQLLFKSHDEAFQPPPVQVEIPTGASSFQAAHPPSPQYDAGDAQLWRL